LGHDRDLSGSCDIIGHVESGHSIRHMRFAIGAHL